LLIDRRGHRGHDCIEFAARKRVADSTEYHGRCYRLFGGLVRHCFIEAPCTHWDWYIGCEISGSNSLVACLQGWGTARSSSSRRLRISPGIRDLHIQPWSVDL